MTATREQPRSGSPLAAAAAYRTLVVAAFVSSWNGLSVGGVQPVDIALTIATLLGSFGMLNSRIATPIWVNLLSLAIVGVLAAHLMAPVDGLYLLSRYTLSVSLDPVSSAAKWLVAVALLPFIVINIVANSERSVATMAWAWTSGAACSALVATLDFLGVTNVGVSLIGYESYSGRESGLASHVNNLGFACAIAIPVAVGLTVRKRLVGVPVLLLLAFGALLSGSRGAQVGVVVAILYTVIIVSGTRRVVPTLALAVGTVAATVALLAPGKLSTSSIDHFLRFDAADSAVQASDSGRTLLAQQALQDFQHNPVIGIGFEVLTHAHSIYLQVLSSGGLLLTVPWIIFWIGLLATAHRLKRSGVPLAGYLLASVLVWLTLGAIENQLTDRYLYFPAAMIAALATSFVKPSNEQAGEPNPLRIQANGGAPEA